MSLADEDEKGLWNPATGELSRRAPLIDRHGVGPSGWNRAAYASLGT